MDRMEAEDFSLFGLLGRSWQLDAEVIDLTFDKSDGAVAFALADGSVAIARTKDSEPAAKRIRISVEDGRSSIQPRTKPLPPITRFTVQDGAPVALTAYGKHGFLIGDASGALTSVTIGGERTSFAPSLNAGIIALKHAEGTGDIACATNNHEVVLIRKGEVEPYRLGHETPISTLAFSPDENLLAVACEGKVTLWEINEKPTKRYELVPCQHPLSLAWSPDQSKLALGEKTEGVTIWEWADGIALTLPDYPAPVRSLVWSHDAQNLVTSGAFRIITWPVNSLKTSDTRPDSLETGKPSLAAVETTAIHPDRRLIMAGYENGMLIIAQIGKSDELLIKAEGQGAVNALKWSHNAGHIAVGSAQGLTSIIELPPQLFK